MPAKTLSDIQAGDEVVMQWYRGYEIHKVSRTTATQIHVDNSKFRKDTGRLIGEHHYPYCSISIDPNHFTKARHQSARAAFEAPRPMTQSDVVARRAECDAAEAALREAGEWTDE